MPNEMALTSTQADFHRQPDLSPHQSPAAALASAATVRSAYELEMTSMSRLKPETLDRFREMAIDWIHQNMPPDAARCDVHPSDLVGIVVPATRDDGEIRFAQIVLAAPYSYFADEIWS